MRTRTTSSAGIASMKRGLGLNVSDVFLRRIQTPYGSRPPAAAGSSASSSTFVWFTGTYG